MCGRWSQAGLLVLVVLLFSASAFMAARDGHTADAAGYGSIAVFAGYMLALELWEVV